MWVWSFKGSSEGGGGEGSGDGSASLVAKELRASEAPQHAFWGVLERRIKVLISWEDGWKLKTPRPDTSGGCDRSLVGLSGPAVPNDIPHHIASYTHRNDEQDTEINDS